MSEVEVVPPKDVIVGVKSKAAKRVETMLKKGRRYFGSSGSTLTHEIANPAYDDKGINKEAAKDYITKVRETTSFLQEWIKDKPNAVLVDSVRTHNWGEEEIDSETGLVSGGYTDHMVFFGDEVIIVDTKDWGKKKNFVVDDEGDVLRSGKPFPGGSTKMDRMIRMWLSYFEAGASLTGIICIQGEENTVFRNRNWFTQSFRIAEIDRFEELLNEKWQSIEDKDKKEINTTLVSQALVECIKPYDEFSRVLNDKAMREFKR